MDRVKIKMLVKHNKRNRSLQDLEIEKRLTIGVTKMSSHFLCVCVEPFTSVGHVSFQITTLSLFVYFFSYF